MAHRNGTPSQLATQFVQLSQLPDESVLGELLAAGAEVAQHEQQIWLRVVVGESAPPAVLSKLPGQRWFNLIEPNEEQSNNHHDSPTLLTRASHRVPTARLPPDLQWKPISEVFDFELPTPAVVPRRSLADRSPLTLIRGGPPRTAAALCLSMMELMNWVSDAPTVRLQPLRWLRQAEHALVMGEPLPPLSGKMFVAEDQVLIPIGFHWQPALPSMAVLQAFCAVEDRETIGCWLIWEGENQWCLVDDHDWVALTRASVRRALEEE